MNSPKVQEPGRWPRISTAPGAESSESESDWDQPRPANHPGTIGIYSTLGMLFYWGLAH